MRSKPAASAIELQARPPPAAPDAVAAAAAAGMAPPSPHHHNHHRQVRRTRQCHNIFCQDDMICGLPQRVFYIAVAASLLVLGATIGLGVGVGIAMRGHGHH